MALGVAFEASETSEPPPAVWRAPPPVVFARFEDGSPGSLPVAIDELVFEEIDDATVGVRVGSHPATKVPRYWLARTLFRIAQHIGVADIARLDAPVPRLGYVETYGGFLYDDSDGFRLGVRGLGTVEVVRERVLGTLEMLYRSVAPPGYREELG